jgi:long-chain fatty acid transport protein
MKKQLFAAGIALCLFQHIWAGGILTNTNQSIHFLRNPARDASIEIDAVYTNPAGLTFLPNDGFFFSINNQSAFQTRTISTTFEPFKGFGDNATKEYEGTASVPIIPSIQAAYKTGDWVLSGSIAITGGGGKATFNKGLPSFESQIAMVPLLISSSGIPTNHYSVDSYMEGSSIIYGAQLGGTYAINDMFSVYGGFRMNIVNNGYVGYLRNIQVNPNLTSVNIPGVPSEMMAALQAKYHGNMVSANEFFTTLGQTENASKVADKELDCSQSGWGVTPVIGFDFKYDKLNIGLKYEFNTSLNVENKTKVDNTGLFADGVNTPHDIPALLTLGAQYDVIEPVTVSVGYHHFFDSNAKMASDKQKNINGGINEYLAGVEWRISRLFLVSAGGQITRTGVTGDYQSDLSFSLHSSAVCIGGAVNVSPTVRINIGYLYSFYQDWTRDNPNYVAGTPIPAKEVFGRTNKTFGVGVDFRF